jgi:hypothetical protein
MFTSHAAIIEALGIAPLAATIGVDASHVRTMKARDSIPPTYWQAVVATAAERGLDGVNLELLAGLAAEKRRQRPIASTPTPEAAE